MKAALSALADLPRWLFCGTLFYAPWAFGCTEPVGIAGLNQLLALTLAFWVVTLLVRREWPLLHTGVAAAAAGVLVLGWTLALNARSWYDPVFNVFVLLPTWRAGLPGTVEGAISTAWMCRATFLLGSLIFVIDLVQRPTWQLRLWMSMAAAATSIALFGLIEKVCRAPTIFWGPFTPSIAFFASYYYHANAGAFLNLTLPLVLTLTLRAISRSNRSGEHALWISASIVMLAAEAVNTSRGAEAIAILLCAALLAWPARPWLRTVWNSHRPAALGFAGLGLVGISVVIGSIGLSRPLARWEETEAALRNVNHDDWRWLAEGASLKVVPAAVAGGFGPGAFRVVFPYYTAYLGERIHGLWEYLHEDYIQTLIEWGLAGTLLWTFLHFGGLGAGWWAYVHRSDTWSRREHLLFTGALLSLLGVSLHALVDFPLQIASLQLYSLTCLGLCWGSLLWPGRAGFGATAQIRPPSTPGRIRSSSKRS